jgi:hypothetical protein
MRRRRIVYMIKKMRGRSWRRRRKRKTETDGDGDDDEEENYGTRYHCYYHGHPTYSCNHGNTWLLRRRWGKFVLNVTWTQCRSFQDNKA